MVVVVEVAEVVFGRRVLWSVCNNLCPSAKAGVRSATYSLAAMGVRRGRRRPHKSDELRLDGGHKEEMAEGGAT